MKTIKITVTTLLVLVTIQANAQLGNYRFGVKLYKQLAYAEAIPYLERALKVDSANNDALRKLADCYLQTGNVTLAKEKYSRIVSLPDVTPLEKYYYGQTLMQTGEHEKAIPWLNSYTADERGKKRASGINNMSAFYKDSALYVIDNYKAINTGSSEFGPAFFGQTILFSSNRYVLDGLDNSHSWTAKDFYSVFLASDDKLKEPLKFTGKVQTRFNDGPLFYDPVTKTLFLTRNQIEKGKAIKGTDGEVKLRIYSYTLDENKNKWTNEVSFAYNNKDYNVAHPTISSNGQWMVFASDMPGTLGGMDLWACQFLNGTWTTPINLGREINTGGNELFPYLSPDNILFFSSDGLEGLGGLDIYYSSFKDGKAGKISTISYPINSIADDFSFIINKVGNIAYFASNREGGSGDDDIYSVEVRKPFRTTISVSGTAKDKTTGEPLAGTKVVLTDNTGNPVAETTTESDGFYEFELVPEKEYKLDGNKVEYSGDKKELVANIPEGQNELVIDLELVKNDFRLYCLVKNRKTSEPLTGVHLVISDQTSGKVLFDFTTDATGEFRSKLENVKLNDEITYNIEIKKDGFLGKDVVFNRILDKPGEIALHEVLDISLDPIEVGADIGKIININPIYFDLNKSNIRTDAATELDKIVKVMEENPTMVIELGSHTDCRSSAAYNMQLSDKRAKASAAYIVSKGIDKKRIYGKGYGEAKLVNTCACEGNKKSDCDEESHQQNRRTEFIIVKM